MDERVKAIRADKKIGEGSCSTVDECYTDKELIAELDEAGITSPEAAVKHFREFEQIRNDYEDDVRGHGNVSPLHSPRIPGHVYDDDPAPEEASTEESAENPYGPYDGSVESEVGLMDDEERFHKGL